MLQSRSLLTVLTRTAAHVNPKLLIYPLRHSAGPESRACLAARTVSLPSLTSTERTIFEDVGAACPLQKPMNEWICL